ncbi:MAG: bifunctional nicotinamidase/pyrazinamidase [Granulosicoccus sp.]|nr:bifunctional nicotinamidase/pyrazinamidase [Granulosicoccus sp.]
MSQFQPDSDDCLLIIDVQNDFCSNGALAVPDAEAILPGINALVERFNTVVLTQDWHPSDHSSFASNHQNKTPFDSITLDYGEQTLWPDHCIQGSAGADFHGELNTDKAQLIIRKGFRTAIDSYSAFFENDHITPTGLSHYLRERSISRVVCVGLALDYCVKFSAIDARAQAFDAVVIESACRGIDIDNSNDAARQEMRECGVEIIS